MSGLVHTSFVRTSKYLLLQVSDCEDVLLQHELGKVRAKLLIRLLIEWELKNNDVY